MAIYHLNAKVISRSTGRSATGASAYRSATHIVDERTGLSHNYIAKSDVHKSMILAPKNVPDWVKNRSELWNKVELSEKRRDAQLAREIDVAIPKELSLKDSEKLITSFVQSEFVDKGMIADINFHDMEGENPHAHIMLTTRHISKEGFGQKNRDWNRRELLQSWRKAWEVAANKVLQLAGFDERIDHRTLEAQGIDRVPQIHLGVKVSEMEERGQRTERGSRALEIQYTNTQIEDLKQEKETINHERSIEIEKGSEQGSIGDGNRAIGAGNGNLSGRDSRSITEPTGSEPQTSRTMVASARENRSNVDRRSERNESVGQGTQRSVVKSSESNATLGAKELGGDDYLSDNGYDDAFSRIIDLSGCKSSNQSKGFGLGRIAQQGINRILNRTYVAMQKQMEVMGGNAFEVSVMTVKGHGKKRLWSKDEVLNAIDWLKRENARGSHVFIKPADQKNNGLVYLSDLNKNQINEMKRKGLEPALLLEDQPNCCDAWIRLSSNEIRPEIAPIVRKQIRSMISGDSYHLFKSVQGSLAGFTNKFYRGESRGRRNPYILLRESSGKVASSGLSIINASITEYNQSLAHNMQQGRLDASKNVQDTNYRRDPVIEYRQRLKYFIEKYQDKILLPKVDFLISKSMAKQGYKHDAIKKALEEASPEYPYQELETKGNAYIQQTVDHAINQKDVKKHLELEKTKSYSMDFSL